MSRPRRRTSSRVRTSKKRISSSVSDFEDTVSSSKGSNYFFRLSVNVQVYYMKIAFGLVSGVIMGLLYSTIPGVTSSWWFIPFSGLILIVILTRRGLNYAPEDLSWPKLILLSGTASLFISFIFTSTLVWLIFTPQNYLT